MTKDEALMLALEALEDLGMKHHENTGEVLYKETFTAIKATLETQTRSGDKGEPVGTAGELFSNTALERLDLRPSTGIYIAPLPVAEPHKRTWVGLTDEEKKSFWTADQMTQEEWDELFSAVETKLKEKNELR